MVTGASPPGSYALGLNVTSGLGFQSVFGLTVVLAEAAGEPRVDAGPTDGNGTVANATAAAPQDAPDAAGVPSLAVAWVVLAAVGAGVARRRRA
jgi:hypothetical protein